MARRTSKPELDPNNHETSLLEIYKWEAYPPDPCYIDEAGNEIDWVWNAARWQWLPEGYKVVEGQWELDA